MKKGFIKTNWDILLTYLLPIIGIILTRIMISGCNAGLGCLMYLWFALIGFLLSYIFLIISIVRNFRNKKLRTTGRIVTIVVFILINIIYFVINNINPFTFFNGGY